MRRQRWRRRGLDNNLRPWLLRNGWRLQRQLRRTHPRIIKRLSQRAALAWRPVLSRRRRGGGLVDESRALVRFGAALVVLAAQVAAAAAAAQSTLKLLKPMRWELLDAVRAVDSRVTRERVCARTGQLTSRKCVVLRVAQVREYDQKHRDSGEPRDH